MLEVCLFHTSVVTVNKLECGKAFGAIPVY